MMNFLPTIIPSSLSDLVSSPGLGLRLPSFLLSNTILTLFRIFASMLGFLCRSIALDEFLLRCWWLGFGAGVGVPGVVDGSTSVCVR